MSNVLEAIKTIYPNINGGYSYFETQPNGKDWVNPIDGLVWENTEYPKPSWAEIEAVLPSIELSKAKTAKIAEIKAKRDEMDLSPLNRYASEAIPAYEVTIDEFLNVTKTTNSVSFVFDVKPLSIPIRTPSEILRDVKESSELNANYFLPYSCDIIDNAGNFIKKGAIALDLAVRNDIMGHLKNRATQNTLVANMLKQQVLSATTIEEVQAISWLTNENDTRFA